MKKVLLLSAVFIVFQITANAQKINGSVRGTLQDSASGAALYDATISVIKAQDSSLVSFTLTSNSGFFEMKKMDLGSYILLVSYQGFQTMRKKFEITSSRPEYDFGTIKMDRHYKTLDEVVIKDEAPIKVKGDTLAYNANAFKTKPNATVEDLLKKLPGVQVDRDGTVKAQGEQVQKVYVDGKEFFGTDPKMATKNLPADMVDEVEVYDDMSEQAKFNKIDDGSRTKAINLKLKKEKKRGLFGQATAGYGSEERYTGNLRANFFKGATQLSVLANANNGNRQGFGTTDFLGMSSMGGGGMNIGGGGGMTMVRTVSGGPTAMGGPGMSSGGGGGITSSWSAGVNYNDTWSKYFDISSSYNINNTSTVNDRKSFQTSTNENNPINRDQNSFSNNDNLVNRGNVHLTYRMNDKNSFIYTTNINSQNNNSDRFNTILSYNTTKAEPYLVNNNISTQNFDGNGTNWNNNLIWRRKFAKAGRTLSVNFNNSLGRNNIDGINKFTSSNYNEGGAKVSDTAANQLTKRRNNTDNFSLSASYTEPVGRDKIWELNYGYIKNASAADRKAYDFNTLNESYDILNTRNSNEFENNNVLNRFGTNFKVLKKKYNYQLGLQVQLADLEGNDFTKSSITKQTSTNFFPNASFNYQFARSRSLRFNYRGRTNQPGISQLQEVEDLGDGVNYTTGNPNLNEEFSNSASVTYNFFDPSRMRNMFATLNFNNTYNKIVNTYTSLGFGRQKIRPENVDGIYGVGANFNYGLPINKMKGGNFNTNTRISFNRDANVVDGKHNYIKTLTLGEEVRLNYNYKEKLDLGVSAGINYSSVKNTNKEQASYNDSYITHTYSLDGSYSFGKGFVLYSDLDVTANNGQAAGYDQDYIMWNASFAKQFFQNKRAELRFTVYDLLDQNVSVSRNIYSNYIEDVQNSVLKRYFMLSFTYKLNRMGGKTMQAPGGNREIRIMQ